MKSLSDTQFQDAVKRHALGETLEAITINYRIWSDVYRTWYRSEHRQIV